MAPLEGIDPVERRDEILTDRDAIAWRLADIAKERMTHVQWALQDAGAGGGDMMRRGERSLTENAILAACSVHAANHRTPPSSTLA